MRISRAAVVMTAALLIAPSAAPTRSPAPRRRIPTQPPLALSEDGYGIVAGYPDAPVQIELYTEPQCSHCEELQSAYGANIERLHQPRPACGDLPPVTFLDTPSTDRHSARVANALFLAVGAPERPTRPTCRRGPSFSVSSKTYGPTRSRAAPDPPTRKWPRMARRQASLTTSRAGSATGDTADDVDIEEMAAYNYGALIGMDPINTGTPTVYDLSTQEKVDIHDRRLAGQLDVVVSLTRQPALEERQPHQCRPGDQPADHRDRSGRNDRQRRVAVLHPNQVGIVLVVFDVNPHARVQFGRIQHAELGPVGDAVGRDELDRRAPRPRAEHLGCRHPHVAVRSAGRCATRRAPAAATATSPDTPR